MPRPEILGLIPARGGSKGIPRKNLALLAGRPLLAYTAAAAQASRHLTRTIVSTDDAEIAAVARELGLDVQMRAAALAGDATPMVDVVRDALDRLDAAGGARPEVLVLLQPTSPLRKAEHIDAAVDLLLESGADAVVSIAEVPHNMTPESIMTLDNGRLQPWSGAGGAVIRQQKPRLFARNGPAVIAVRPASARQRGLYEGDVRGFVMARRESLDIDDEMDLKLAEFWLAQQ